MTKTTLIIALTTLLLVAGCQQQENQLEYKKESSRVEISSGDTNSNQKQEQSANDDNTLTLPAQYFNQILEVDGKSVIQNYENTLARGARGDGQ